MSELDALIFANEAFYRAFADRDIEALDALWSKTAPVACIHPGWNALDERDTIIDSFQAILTGPTPPEIECHSPRAIIYGESGLVICYEYIDGQVLVATNVFVRKGHTWQIVHHQAGPAQDLPPEEATNEPESIN